MNSNGNDVPSNLFLAIPGAKKRPGGFNSSPNSNNNSARQSKVSSPIHISTMNMEKKVTSLE